MVIGYLSTIDWDFLWQRPQALVQSLGARCDVIYFEPPAGLLQFLRHPARGFARLAAWWKGGREVEPGIRVVPLLPFALPFAGPLTAAYYDWLVWVSLKWLKWRLGLPTLDLLITALSDVVVGIGALPARMRVYDCMDDRSVFTDWRQRVRQKREEALCHWVDAITVTSTPLLERNLRRNPRTVLVPNGVDAEFVESGLAAPQPAAAGGAPRIGFIGAIYWWVDIPLISRLAEARPDYQFVLIGPVETDVSSLADRPNVQFLGTRPHSELPGLIHSLDVCLLPFTKHGRIEAANPVIAYEYLAFGKPVVTSAPRLADLFEGFLTVAETPEAFLAAVDEAVAASHSPGAPEEALRRMQFAARNTWAARAEEVLRLTTR